MAGWDGMAQLVLGAHGVRPLRGEGGGMGGGDERG